MTNMAPTKQHKKRDILRKHDAADEELRSEHLSQGISRTWVEDKRDEQNRKVGI